MEIEKKVEWIGGRQRHCLQTGSAWVNEKAAIKASEILPPGMHIAGTEGDAFEMPYM